MQIPSTLQISLFALCCAVLAFFVRFKFPIGYNFIGLQLGYFVLYIVMYLAGIIASRKNWLEQLSFKTGVRWYIIQPC
jgi:hypothetical protein